MNFNFNFENIQFDKKAKPITIGIIAVLVIVFSIISIGLFNNYQADDIEDSKQKAELVSMNVSKDLEETVKSISYLSELISSNNLKAKITSDEVTTLLNSLISSDEKIFAAFVLLDKSEYEDLEDLNITNVKELAYEKEEIPEDDEDESDEAEDEDLDDEEDLEDEEHEEDEEEEEPSEIKPSVVNGLNKLIFRSGEGTSETTLDRINNLDYKKNYLKVLLSKEPQTMLPLVNSYNGIEKKTITYTMPILVDGFVEGVIGLDIDTEKLNSELNKSNDVLGGTYLLLSKDNNVIVSNKPEYIGIGVDEVYGSKKLKKFFEESLESMELSSIKSKTAS
ncbi:MAG: hypothetical protein MJ246_03010 [Clostridia bacterium]|nr:hypothetical protein [Clostridia bacterium]